MKCEHRALLYIYNIKTPFLLFKKKKEKLLIINEKKNGTKAIE